MGDTHLAVGGDPFAPIRALGPVAPKAPPEIWEPRLPCGVDAPATSSITWKGWGTATRVFRYLDERGALLFLVARFERLDAKGKPEKHTVPYTYGHREWTPKGRERRSHTGWHFKRADAPVPLYGLDRLATIPGLVCLCEGEKAADAAQALWSDVACIASIGGSANPKASAWGPLAGRDVAIWPDNDEPGARYAAAAAELLHAAGAASVRIVQIDPAWPEGWDLGDAPPDGVSTDTLRALLEHLPPAAPDTDVSAFRTAEIERLSRLSAVDYAAARKEADRVLRIGLTNLDRAVKHLRAERAEARKAEWRNQPAPNAGEVRWPYGYDMRDGGLYFDPGGEALPMRLCAPLKVLGEGRDAEGEGWALYLTWLDGDGREHRWAMPKKLLAQTQGELEGMLLHHGLDLSVDPAARKALREAFAEVRAGARVTLVDEPGWFLPPDAPGAFVLPSGDVVGEIDEVVVLRTKSESASSMVAQAGDLDGWQGGVARYAERNPIPSFLMCAGFVGPLLELLGQTSGGFHIQGQSKVGKTLVARMAVSAWGPARKGGLYRDWRSTANGMEGAAEESSGSLLFLDEIHQAEPRDIVAAVYMLANEQGRGRMTRETTARRRKRWRTSILSTGECDVATMAAKAGQTLPAGAEVRIPTIPVTGEAMWAELHGFAEPRLLMDAINAGLAKQHGSAIVPFLERLVAERNADLDGLLARFERMRESFSERLEPDSDMQVHEVAKRCAIFAFAGELAIEWGILPWMRGSAESAAIHVLVMWLERRGGHAATEDRIHLQAIRTFLVQHGMSRFCGLARQPGSSSWEVMDSRQLLVSQAGFRRLQDDGRFEFLIDPDVWPKICAEAGVDPSDCARTLAAHGMLAEGDGKHLAKKQRTPAGKGRYFTVSPDLLGEECEPAPRQERLGMPSF